MDFSKPRVALYYNVLPSTGYRNDGANLFMMYNLKKLLDGVDAFKNTSLMTDPKGNVVPLSAIDSQNYGDFGKFDLHGLIDWGEDGLGLPLDWELPHPNFYWIADSHLGYEYRLKRARQFDTVFASHKPSIERMIHDLAKEKLFHTEHCVSHKQIVKLSNEILQLRKEPYGSIISNVPSLPQGIYAAVEKISSSESITEIEDELSFLHACLCEKGNSEETSMQLLREYFIPSTPPGLLQTSPSYLALSSLSLTDSQKLNLPKINYLPWAAEPMCYKPYPIIEKWDWSFIGYLNNDFRIDLVDRFCKEWPLGDKGYLGWRNPNIQGYNVLEDVAKKFSQSRLILNESIRDDLNMRTFEALACKRLLLTEDIPAVRDHFEDDKHLVLFKTIDEAMEKARYYLAHKEDRERIAKAGYEEFLANHTYMHRAKHILKMCLNWVPDEKKEPVLA